jgi:hypothetical protein
MRNPATGGMNSEGAAIATLNIRVTSIEGRVSELASTVNGVQAALSTKIDGLATALGSKIEERGRPQWAIYIAGAMAVFSVYAYMDTAKIGPLKEVDSRIEARMDRMSNKIETEMVPIWVHQKVWNITDDTVKRLTEGNTERIKRIEEQFGNAYNLRDAIQQLDARVRHFENMSPDKRP